jgi:hypothetical protein
MVVRSQPDPFTELLRDGSNDPDAARDFSSAPVLFTAGPPTGVLWFVPKVVIVFVDMFLTSGRYGDQVLTNGIIIKVFQTSGDQPITLIGAAAGGLKSLDEIATACQIQVQSLNMLKKQVQISVLQEKPKTISLNGDRGGFMEVTLNDDFSALSFHQFRLHGTRRASV